MGCRGNSLRVCVCGCLSGSRCTCVYLLMGHLHARRAAALKKKKKVHGTDWFPGPDMPVNMGRRSVLSCTGLPSLLGQQPWGPQPSCSPRHHAVESIVIPLQAQLFQKSRRPDTSKDISRPTPTFVPQAPQKVRSEGCRAGRRRPPPPSSPPCLSPFLLTNTRLPVSALPPQTTAFLLPGRAAGPGWGDLWFPVCSLPRWLQLGEELVCPRQGLPFLPRVPLLKTSVRLLRKTTRPVSPQSPKLPVGKLGLGGRLDAGGGGAEEGGEGREGPFKGG